MPADDEDEDEGLGPFATAIITAVLAGLVLMVISRALPPAVPANDNARAP